MIITQKNKIYALGNNDYGQLGLDDQQPREVPEELTFNFEF
jgi:alpha-tubulin suppressor-like RCC1 family protein